MKVAGIHVGMITGISFPAVTRLTVLDFTGFHRPVRPVVNRLVSDSLVTHADVGHGAMPATRRGFSQQPIGVGVGLLAGHDDYLHCVTCIYSRDQHTPSDGGCWSPLAKQVTR